MNGVIQRDRLLKGAGYFAVFTVVGLGVLFAITVREETLQVFGNLSLGFILLALLTTGLDTVIGAIRYQIYLRRIKPGTSLWLPIRADLANRFTGAVTPSQTGGGPAQVFVLFKGGIPIPDALSFLAINFLCTMVFFLLAGGFTAYMFRGDFSGGALQLLIRYGFVAFASMGAFMFVALLRPDLIERFCTALVERMGNPERGWAAAVQKAGAWVVDSLGQYHAACTRFIREAPMLLVWSFLLTVVLYVNKFTLAYFILRGLGVEAPYLDVLAVQALLQFILYVAPSPGGSGIAELTTAALMVRFMDTHLLGVFTIAFRFFLLYLPASLGCLVLVGALKPGGRKASRRWVYPATPAIGRSSDATSHASQERLMLVKPISSISGWR